MSSNPSSGSNAVNTGAFPSWQSAVDQCLEKLETTIDIAINMLAYPGSDVSQGVFMFIGDYLGLLKNTPADNAATKPQSKAAALANGAPEKNKILIELTSDRMFKLERLLRVLVDKLKYPDDEVTDDVVCFLHKRYLN